MSKHDTAKGIEGWPLLQVQGYYRELHRSVLEPDPDSTPQQRAYLLVEHALVAQELIRRGDQLVLPF